MNQPLLTLVVGFVLGLEHAFEVDHIIAVSTMVSEHKNPFRAALVGTFWGIGHTTTLFVVGLIVLFFKLTIPQKIISSFEFFVGVMLIILGLRVLSHTRREQIHHHSHSHDDFTHTHLHLHPSRHQSYHHHRHSFVIGAVHGLAGSGALMVLVLSTVRSALTGAYYILIFGIGGVIGMTIMSFVVGLPFIFSVSKFGRVEKALKLVAGTVSIGFGMYLIYTIGFSKGLFFTFPIQ